MNYTKTYSGYKIIRPDGGGAFDSAHNSGFRYDLPKGRKPGAWTSKIDGDIEVCFRGYHDCTRAQMPAFVHDHQSVVLRPGYLLVAVESKSRPTDTKDKRVSAGPMRVRRVVCVLTAKKLADYAAKRKLLYADFAAKYNLLFWHCFRRSA